MSRDNVMSIDDLRGRTVLSPHTGEKVGEVADVVIHPTQGRMLGITIRDGSKTEQALALHDFSIGRDAVMLSRDASMAEWNASHLRAEGAATGREIIGTRVVTESGALIGKVSGIYVALDPLRTAYRVTESTLQRFLGGGFYIPGDLPSAYSGDGPRMIVPADTEERFASDSPLRALGAEPG